MNRHLKHAAMLVAMSLSVLASTSAVADSGSGAFDRYVQDVRLRMQAAANGSYWISTEVDHGAYDRYLAAMGESAAGPGLTATATFLASLEVQPLRTFNGYLAYLGQRMRADAGPPGALLQTHRGTGPFDRYIEEINHRIQALYLAEEGTGF